MHFLLQVYFCGIWKQNICTFLSPWTGTCSCVPSCFSPSYLIRPPSRPLHLSLALFPPPLSFLSSSVLDSSCQHLPLPPSLHPLLTQLPGCTCLNLNSLLLYFHFFSTPLLSIHLLLHLLRFSSSLVSTVLFFLVSSRDTLEPLHHKLNTQL